MSLLALQDVAKAYDAKPVLRGVDLVVNEGDRIGLLGRNGSGKTTLLKILAGVERPDSGERVAKRDLKLGWLEQAPKLDLALTVRDAVRLGLVGRERVLAAIEAVHQELGRDGIDADRIESLLSKQDRLEAELATLGGHDVEHKIEAMVRSLGLRDVDASCGTLSGGEQRRVALARLLVGTPDLLLLDEPTNHLDALVTDWLEDRLLESRVPLLLVTHDRYFLDRVVDRIVELEHGRLVEYDGGYAQYLWKRAERDHAAGNAAHERRMLLRRETAWARRGPPARTTKSKSRMARWEALVADGGDAAIGTVSFTLPPGPRLGTKVLELHGATKSFDGRVVVPTLDFELRAGMRLGIVGPNGAGKSTFLSLCTGALVPDGGVRAVGDTVKFAAIDQQRRGLDPKNTVVDEVASADMENVRVGGQTMRIESFLDRFLFPGPTKFSRVEDLSGGERNRVLLAKLLIQAGNVVVLDEPTNDLDLETLRTLEEALVAFEGAALIVSHDRWFLDRVATHVLYMDGEGHTRLHEGDLSSLLERIARERAAEEARAAQEAQAAKRKTAARAASTAAAAASPANATPPKRKLSFKEAKELEALPERIAEIEARGAELDRRFADPALYKGLQQELAKLQGERTDLKRALEIAYERWEELEALREKAP